MLDHVSPTLTTVTVTCRVIRKHLLMKEFCSAPSSWIFKAFLLLLDKAAPWCDVHTHTSPVLHIDDLRVVYKDLHSITKSNQPHPGVNMRKLKCQEGPCPYYCGEGSESTGLPASENPEAQQSLKSQTTAFLACGHRCHFTLLLSESPESKNTESPYLCCI